MDLTNYIKTCGAKYWIFGHSHRNINKKIGKTYCLGHSHRNINKKIGKTYCLCNQVGYVMAGENETFSLDKNIDTNQKDKDCLII